VIRLLMIAVALLASVPVGTAQAQCAGGECAVEAGGPMVKVAVALPGKVVDRVRARPLIRRARARVHVRPLVRGFRARFRRCR